MRGRRRPCPGARPAPTFGANDVIRNWRSWVLLVLLVGPVLAYMGFGAVWLYQRGWLLIAGALWFGSGIVFEDRGTHRLKGVPEPWRLFALHDG